MTANTRGPFPLSDLSCALGLCDLFAEKIMRQFQVLRFALCFTGVCQHLWTSTYGPRRINYRPVAKVQRKCPGSQSGIKTATRRVSQLDSLAMILCGARSCNMNRNAFPFLLAVTEVRESDCEFESHEFSATTITWKFILLCVIFFLPPCGQARLIHEFSNGVRSPVLRPREPGLSLSKDKSGI